MHYRINDNLSEVTPELFARLLSEVSEQRREKVMAYKHESGRVQSLMAYVTLKDLLHEQYGFLGNPMLIIGEHDKPSLSHSNLQISISHCSKGVAAAVDERPVGIDIERIQSSVKDDLCRYVLNEREYASILASDKPEVEFTRLWTMKEALLKLKGTGLVASAELKDILLNTEQYNFKTIINEDREWVMSVCSIK